jgi:hypothetical protein
MEVGRPRAAFRYRNHRQSVSKEVTKSRVVVLPSPAFTSRPRHASVAGSTRRAMFSRRARRRALVFVGVGYVPCGQGTRTDVFANRFNGSPMALFLGTPSRFERTHCMSTHADLLLSRSRLNHTALVARLRTARDRRGSPVLRRRRRTVKTTFWTGAKKPKSKKTQDLSLKKHLPMAWWTRTSFGTTAKNVRTQRSLRNKRTRRRAWIRPDRVTKKLPPRYRW